MTNKKCFKYECECMKLNVLKLVRYVLKILVVHVRNID